MMTFLVQDKMAESLAAVVCRNHYIWVDQGVWLAGEGSPAVRWHGCYDTKAVLDGYVLRSAEGEAIDTDEMGLGGCWECGTLPS
jgi:hypothetical protein